MQNISGNGYRIVIVKFTSESIKHKLFRGRDALRANGIRISEEQTTRQRTELNNLKAQGKAGFYIKGKLHIRSDDDNRDNTRQFVNAKRKMQHMDSVMKFTILADQSAPLRLVANEDVTTAYTLISKLAVAQISNI